MPDDLHPENHAADARDERVTRLLAVEPLDDFTRRRLVSTALGSMDGRSTRSARRARQLVAAAAIVFVAVAGAGVVVALQGGPDGDSESVTAQGAPRDAGRALSDAPLGSVPDAGDFGELTTAANVARLRTALAAVEQSPDSSPSAAAADKAEGASGSESLSARVKELRCTPTLPDGATVAVATGTYDGRDVVVVQREAAGGARSLLAVDRESCAVHRLS